MRSSGTIDNLAGALVLAQAEIENPRKDAKGQVRGRADYQYASLPAILTAVKPILTKNGLAVMQEAVGSNEGVGVITRLLHVSGEWLELGPLLLPPQSAAQDAGSALTYAKRYALTALLAIEAADDDGAKASRKSSGNAGQQTPAAASPRGGAVPPPSASEASGTGASPGGETPVPTSSGAGAAQATTDGTGITSPSAPASDDVVASAEAAASGQGAFDSSTVVDGEAAPSTGESTLPAPHVTVALPMDEPNARATDEQWQRLLATVGGSMTKAVTRLNRANKTRYTAATAQEGATRQEVANAITGEAA